MKLGRDKKRDVMNHVSTLVSLFLICSVRCIRQSYQLTDLFASFYGLSYEFSFLPLLTPISMPCSIPFAMPSSKPSFKACSFI